MLIMIKPKVETVVREYATSPDRHDIATVEEIYTIDSIFISVIELKLYAYAAIETVFFEGSKFVKKVVDMIDNDNYKNWSSDDDYIINYILNKYGLNFPEGNPHSSRDAEPQRGFKRGI